MTTNRVDIYLLMDRQVFSHNLGSTRCLALLKEGMDPDPELFFVGFFQDYTLERVCDLRHCF